MEWPAVELDRGLIANFSDELGLLSCNPGDSVLRAFFDKKFYIFSSSEIIYIFLSI
jgi:hypothetical protein